MDNTSETIVRIRRHFGMKTENPPEDWEAKKQTEKREANGVEKPLRAGITQSFLELQMNKPFEFIVIGFIREFIVFISHSTVLVYSLRHFFPLSHSVGSFSEEGGFGHKLLYKSRPEKRIDAAAFSPARGLRWGFVSCPRPSTSIASMIEKLISTKQMPEREILVS